MNQIQPSVLSPSHENSDFSKGNIFFVGTATVILRYGGFTILTDPNFLHQGGAVSQSWRYCTFEVAMSQHSH